MLPPDVCAGRLLLRKQACGGSSRARGPLLLLGALAAAIVLLRGPCGNNQDDMCAGTVRCGVDWTEANRRCGKPCSWSAPSSCPLGEACFRRLNPSSARSDPTSFQREMDLRHHYNAQKDVTINLSYHREERSRQFEEWNTLVGLRVRRKRARKSVGREYNPYAADNSDASLGF